MNSISNWTGERLETFIFNETSIEHLHRYAIAREFVANKSVLDIACGEGYGSYLLSEKANSVTCIDIDLETVERAKKKYTNANINFLQGNVINIPCLDNSFDVIISFETLEHISEHQEMMAEIKRVLKTNGVLIISTPDRYSHSDKKSVKSKFHIKELYEEEFKSLIKKFYSNSIFLSQKSMFCSAILHEKNDNPLLFYDGHYLKIESSDTFSPSFHIAIASDNELSVPTSSSIFSSSLKFQEILNQQELSVKRTLSYKIGHIILYPLKILRSLFLKTKTH